MRLVRQLDHPTTRLPSMPNQRLPNNPRLRKTSMTTTITETTCDGNPACFHTQCKHCNRIIRGSNDLAKHHPNTVVGSATKQECGRCRRQRDGYSPGAKLPYDHCVQCEIPLRSSYELLEDRPGTRQHVTRGLCFKCYHKGPPEDVVVGEYVLTPADMQDQRHILLSNAELEHVKEVSPFMYDWHMARRKRLKLGQYRTR